MPAGSNNAPEFDPAVLDQLACPACLGVLRLGEAQLICAACARAYPLVEGIPVLIPARAEKPQS
jgi:uncharacterized protein YbaR (Trm112 family)